MKLNMKRKPVDFDDDIVIVWKNNRKVYQGLEDDDPMRDAPWRFDRREICYRYTDGKNDYVKVALEV